MKRIVLSVVILLAGLFAASEIWPSKAAKAILSGLHLFTGMSPQQVETPIGPVGYLRGGSGETVVLLHGIFARKEHWLDMSRQLSGYDLVMLDLPGFGDNPVLDGAEYAYDRQVANVFATLDALGIKEFHLVGNSMGSQIATMMAASRPDQIKTISYIGSPVGVTAPTPSDMERAIAEGSAPLVVRSTTQYQDRMAWLFPKEPFLPRPLAREWREAEIARADSNQVIWDQVNASLTTPTDQIASQLTLPSLVIWCTDDRIFHPTGAAVLDAALPDNTLITPSGCGHLPMLDRPKETGQELRAFLDKH